MFHVTLTEAQGDALVDRYNKLVVKHARMPYSNASALLSGDEFDTDMQLHGSHEFEIRQHITRTGRPDFFSINAEEVTIDTNHFLAKLPTGDGAGKPGHRWPDGLVPMECELDDGDGGTFGVCLTTSGGDYVLSFTFVADEADDDGFRNFDIECRFDGERLVLAPLPDDAGLCEHIGGIISRTAEVAAKDLAEWERSLVGGANRKLFSPDEVLSQEGLEPVADGDSRPMKIDHGAILFVGTKLVRLGTDFGRWSVYVQTDGTAKVNVGPCPQKVAPAAKQAARKAIRRWAIAQAGIAEDTAETDRRFPSSRPVAEKAKLRDDA